jgi:hypothetical protein
MTTALLQRLGVLRDTETRPSGHGYLLCQHRAENPQATKLAPGNVHWAHRCETGVGGKGQDVDTVALLGLKMCFDLVTKGDQDFTVQVSTFGCGSTNNDSGAIQLRGER